MLAFLYHFAAVLGFVFAMVEGGFPVEAWMGFFAFLATVPPIVGSILTLIIKNHFDNKNIERQLRIIREAGKIREKNLSAQIAENTEYNKQALDVANGHNEKIKTVADLAHASLETTREAIDRLTSAPLPPLGATANNPMHTINDGISEISP